MNENTITLNGATIDYHRHGRGQPLLLIPGGAGHAGIFGPIVARLSEHFDVVAASSRVASANGPANALEDQCPRSHAEDVRGLIEALFDEPPIVFSSSSGAITAVEMLTRHADHVRLTIAHEPPLIGLLQDSNRHRAALEAVRAAARAGDMETAMPMMATAMTAADTGRKTPDLRHWGDWLDGYADTGTEPPTPELKELSGRLGELQPAFLNHILVPFATHEPDLAALSAAANRLVLAAGIDSRGELPYQTTAALATRLGLPLTEFPGGHLGPVERPTQFAAVLTHLLLSTTQRTEDPRTLNSTERPKLVRRFKCRHG